MTLLKWCFALLLLLTTPLVIYADQESDEEESLYQTYDERRESVFGIELNEWMTLTGSLEFEKENLTLHFEDRTRSVENEDPTQTLQIGFEIGISENIGIELVLEGESSDRIHGEIDEGFMVAEFDNLNFQVGRIDLPFGEFYSYFVADPLLQFGETKADALVIEYEFAEFLTFSPFVFDSKVSKEFDNDSVDWGVVLSFINENESIRIGAGYISDLAESDEQLLFDFGNRFRSACPELMPISYSVLSNSRLRQNGLRPVTNFVNLKRNSISRHHITSKSRIFQHNVFLLLHDWNEAGNSKTPRMNATVSRLPGLLTSMFPFRLTI